MTSDTFANRGIGDVYYSGNPRRQKAVKVGTGETIKPGYAIYVSNGVAYAAKSTDPYISGIACCMDGHEIDTAYTSTSGSEENIEYYGKGQDTEVWAFLVASSPAVTIDEGELLVVSSTDGMFTLWSYASGAEETDTLSKAVRSRDYKAGSASDNKLVRISLSA